MAASSDHWVVKRVPKRAISRRGRLFVAVGIIVGKLRHHPMRFCALIRPSLVGGTRRSLRAAIDPARQVGAELMQVSIEIRGQTGLVQMVRKGPWEQL